jgi:hypothetical protein
MLSLILLVFAFVLCVIAAFWQYQPNNRPHFGWLAMACYFLSMILGNVKTLLG